MSSATVVATSPRKKANRPGNRNRKPTAWQRSATFAALGIAALAKFQKERHRRKKCGAKTRLTGAPCKQLALENGRCHWHGGATPKGRQWNKRQLKAKPNSHQTKHDWRRTEAKLQRQAREDRDRVRRLRQMTDHQFYAYVQRMGRRLDDPHAPTIKNAIRAEFARRGPAPSTMTSASPTPRPVDPELAEIEARLADLRRQRDEIAANQLHQGVFA